MHAFALLLCLLADRYWETSPPREWDNEQLLRMFADSPWAQSMPLRGFQDVWIFLASARPMQEAEAEIRRRRGIKDDSSFREYKAYLEENHGKIIVVAVRIDKPLALLDAAESRAMEEQSFLKAGRKKFKIQGHFPPTDTDPMLRLVFPRVVGEHDKDISFELYVPGVPGQYRQASFPLKALRFKGELEL